MVAAFGLLATPSITFAAEPPGDVIAPVVVSGDSSIVTLTPISWTIVTGLVMPFVVSIVLKASASKWFKGLVAIILAFVAAVVERATLADGTAVFTSGLLLDNLLIYAPQLLTYVGFWSHLNLNERLAPNVGLSDRRRGNP